MPVIAAVLFCALMAGLAAFQGSLIAGAPLGRFAWGGQDRVLPRGKRIGSGTSIVLYAVFAVVVLNRAGLVGDASWRPVSDVAVWVLVAYFLLGIALNGLSRSRPERWTMTPLCAVLAGLTAVVAVG